MNTKKELIDRIYFLLWEDQTSPVFDKEKVIMPSIHSVIDDICRCKITNIITGQTIKWGLLDFVYKEKTLNIPRSIILNQDIDEETAVAEVSSTQGLKEQGILEVNGNIFTYWGKSTNELYEISGINGYHKKGSQIFSAYKFPGSIIKASDFWDIEKDKQLELVDFREGKKTSPCYCIKPTKGGKVAVFYNFEWPVRISYTSSLAKMESDDDECGFPEDYGIKILPYLVVGELLINTSEISKGKELLAKGYSALEDMYSFYATPAKQYRKKIKSASLTLDTR